ncbi:MAG TPA: hypothetical protein VJA82_07075 [Sediminibacterium sp.]|uniref:hypothetical protein n=1 Tax=Sediminibacterium sp. TaxID=1917865 RepID=UPI0008BAEBC7|nr:hypothetical protein [Sediminibacterium sp.]OHC84572.1 MAG: hypothetical protein A2472_11465 [Sphingobacteriia bacterium RIFOXYC2_FULL_35_18]OHC87493.1 MAG: hypothetical protein A2546_07880 [Sphingobacteriia bacterium RIFOXYD2_FULL_35_12]HLD53046.1 hypothetical protein [Sediminibacterium sp.]
MTNNQQNIIRKLQWIIYPIVVLIAIDFFIRFFNNDHDPLAVNTPSNQIIQWIDLIIMAIVFVVVGFVVVALMQQFFTKKSMFNDNTNDAPFSKELIRIEAPSQIGGQLIVFMGIIGFSVFENTMIFAPDFIFEPNQIEAFSLFEKLVFGFFYILTHFLVIVFGQRLFKGMPPIFIATEKGFCYEPAGVSSGWILWKDVVEVEESTVLSGSGVNNGPVLMPVIGIKLKNPEEYNNAAYAPLLKYVVRFGQKFHNYQTEGVGDILLRPSDFGNQYAEVVALFKSKVKS